MTYSVVTCSNVFGTYHVVLSEFKNFEEKKIWKKIFFL